MEGDQYVGTRVGLARNLRGAVEFLRGKQSSRWAPLKISAELEPRRDV